MRKWFAKGSMLMAFTALALAGCKKAPQPESPAAGANAQALVKAQMFVMSKCPFGVRALDAMLQATDTMAPQVDLDIQYIGEVKPDGTLDSMHGQAEVDGNIAQLCVKKVAPQAHRKFLSCVNKTWQSIPENTASCATEAGVDAAALQACRTGADGKAMLKTSFETAAKAGVEASPTIKIAGNEFQGLPRVTDFQRALCGAMGAKAPAACQSIPAPPQVNVIALTDKRCKECDVAGVIKSLREVFPGLNPRVLDWSEADAKTIATAANVKTLPAVLFDKTIMNDKEGSQVMMRYLQPEGEYVKLRVPAEFDPTAEICDNKIDDTGDGKVDCDDDTCKETLACRPEQKGRLDVFVMSQCPYGVMALNSMKDVLGAFGNEIDFHINYIADTDGKQFQSLHGQPEVDENIRELCAIKHYGANRKYMDYIWCRNQNIQSPEWRSCTGSNGVQAAVIDKCASGEEGRKLLADNLKLAKSMKIGASPTWMVNNRVAFNGVTAADIQKNLCQHNPTLKGCSKPLAGAQPGQQVPAGNCGH